MAAKQARKGSFIIGLVAIVLLYCVYYLFFVYGLFIGMASSPRHFTKLVFVVLVYSIGFWALRRGGVVWTTKVWHLLYGLTICIMVGMTLYDWGVGRLSASSRSVADDLQDFLVSPLPYVCIELLRRSFLTVGSDRRKEV
jgi:hypothetical protein